MDYMILYHIGPGVPHPVENRETTRYGITTPGGWDRPWVQYGPEDRVVFLTPDPAEVHLFHGVKGNVYAFRVPMSVVRELGGIHRFDGAREIIIPERLWGRVEFLGRANTHRELEYHHQDHVAMKRRVKVVPRSIRAGVTDKIRKNADAVLEKSRKKPSERKIRRRMRKRQRQQAASRSEGLL